MAGGATGGFIGGAGGALMEEGNIAVAGLKGAIGGGLTGGLIGGIGGGIFAVRNGGDFWDGIGAEFKQLAPTHTSNSVQIGEGLEYTNECGRSYAKTLTKRPRNTIVYADGSTCSDCTVVGDLMYDSNGNMLRAVTEYRGPGVKMPIYLSKLAFESKEQLYLTLGHEYIHVAFAQAGNLNANQHHASIYRWQAKQGSLWKFRGTTDYHQQARNFLQYFPARNLNPFGYMINRPWLTPPPISPLGFWTN